MIKTKLFRLMIIPLTALLFTNTLISQNKSFSEKDPEKISIRSVVENLYVRGLKTRVFALIREACIPDTKLMGVNKNEKLQVTTLDQWSKKFNPKKPPFKKLFAEIAKIDIVGTAAQVKLNFIINEKQKVTDYLQMLKIQKKWKIVNIIDY